jgi:hypothetical protein
MVIKSSIFWDTIPRSLLKVSRRFEWIYRFYLKGRRISQARHQYEAGSKQSFLWNFGWLSTDCTAIFPRRRRSSSKELISGSKKETNTHFFCSFLPHVQVKLESTAKLLKYKHFRITYDAINCKQHTCRTATPKSLVTSTMASIGRWYTSTGPGTPQYRELAPSTCVAANSRNMSTVTEKNRVNSIHKKLF